MSAQKKTYYVSGRFSVTVSALDEDEAEMMAEDMAPGLSLRLVGVECLSPPGPYAMPPGVGSWGPHLEAIRLADDEPRHVGEWDGAWWWGNKHLVLRCPGPCVPEHGGSRHDIGAIRGVVAEKAPATWVDCTGDDAKAFRCGNVGISRVYRALVEAGAPGCSWWVGGPRDPILAKDSSGRIVAIVMPMAVSS